MRTSSVEVEFPVEEGPLAVEVSVVLGWFVLLSVEVSETPLAVFGGLWLSVGSKEVGPSVARASVQPRMGRSVTPGSLELLELLGLFEGSELDGISVAMMPVLPAVFKTLESFNVLEGSVSSTVRQIVTLLVLSLRGSEGESPSENETLVESSGSGLKAVMVGSGPASPSDESPDPETPTEELNGVGSMSGVV